MIKREQSHDWDVPVLSAPPEITPIAPVALM